MRFEIWLLFLGTIAMGSVSPGPNAAFSMAVAFANGIPRSLMAPVGFALAGAVHILVVFLGLGTVLLTSAEAFHLIKWLGISYLIWLGIRQWRRDDGFVVKADAPDRNGPKLMLQAMAVSLTNPKSFVVTLALFPAFIFPSEPLVPQFLVMGLTAVFVPFAIYSGYVLMAANVRVWLLCSKRERFLGRLVGSFYLIAAAGLATLRRSE